MAAYQHRTTTLDNGLKVVTVSMPHLHSANVALYAGVGSRHETPDENGISHFLEHMYFRGCDAFPDSTKLNGAMEDLGGYLDGFTTRDYSGYQTTVHPQFITDATEILGAMFTGPHFSQIDVERSIVLEEMLDALDERGKEIDVDVLSHREAFPGHGLSQPIDGVQKNVRRFSVDDLFRHRKRFYGAKNLVLCFAGRIEPAACRRAAKRGFGKLPAGRKAAAGRRPPAPETRRLRFARSDDAQTRVRLSFRTVSPVHRDYPALIVLRRVFDGGLSARLQVELVEKRGLVYEVGADLNGYADCGLLDFELAVANDRLAVALSELRRVIGEVVDDGITTDELTRIKNRARCTVEFGLDSPSEMSHWFGAERLFAEPKAPEARLAELEAVTADDISRIARKYLSWDRMTVAAVGAASAQARREAKKVLSVR